MVGTKYDIINNNIINKISVAFNMRIVSHSDKLYKGIIA